MRVLEMSKVLLFCWLALEVLVLAVLLWATYGLNTWDSTPAAVITASPDAAYYIRKLTSIASISVGVLAGLGLPAILLTIASLRLPRRGSRTPLATGLLFALVAIPAIALAAVIMVGGDA